MSDWTKKVNRFELIDASMGRIFVRYDCQIEVSLQDDGETLKVFLKAENNTLQP